MTRALVALNPPRRVYEFVVFAKSTVSVRVRSVTAEGPSDWLGPVRFLVG